MKNIKRLAVFTFALLFTSSIFAVQDKQTMTPIFGWPEANDFKLVDTNGTLHKLSDHKGQVVIVNFWAVRCPSCRKEMPSMQRAWLELEEEGIVMLAINIGEDEQLISKFTDMYPVTFPILMDKDLDTAKSWFIRGLPSTYIIDPYGEVAYRAIGSREWDDAELLDRIRALKK